MSETMDREWTQAELRAHLIAQGWKESDFIEGDVIPQGVKYTSQVPPTEEDIAWAKKQITEMGKT